MTFAQRRPLSLNHNPTLTEPRMARPTPHERMIADNGAGWISLAIVGQAVYRVWLRSPGGTWYRYDHLSDAPQSLGATLPRQGGHWRIYLAGVRDGSVRCIEGKADPYMDAGVVWRLAAASEGMTRPWHPPHADGGGAHAVACAALEAVRLARPGAVGAT